MPLQQTSGNVTSDAYGSGGAAVVPTYIEDVFSTYLYTGNGSTQTITNGIDLSTKGGLVWIKGRGAATNNLLFDTNRGVNNYLVSDGTNSQANPGDTLSAFNTTGFQVTDLSNFINENAFTYVSWTFRKQPKFFDVVTYTGDGIAGRTVAHNLGSVPGCIIVKETGSANDWIVYHLSSGNGSYITLNSTRASAVSSTRWNDTTPTSTVFTVGTNNGVNGNGSTYVAYLFAHNAGGFGLTGTDNVISCGSFNGSVDVNLGYEAQWVLIKDAGGVGDWYLLDIMRGMSNTQGAYLRANVSNAEASTEPAFIVPTATGFKNVGGGNYIYIAIRRGPMKVPTLGTSVFSPIASSDSQGTQQTTGFPVDLQIAAYRPGNANNSTANDRLRGVSSTSTGNTSTPLVTSSTAAETAGGIGTQGWNNTGFGIPAFLSISSSIYWNFRRAPSFMDVVCYTGTGSALTVSHNLAAVPELIIGKNRTTAGNNWPVLFNFASTTMNYGFLNLTNSCPNDTYANVGVFSAAPTSTSMFLLSSGSMNTSANNQVAYLFATCAGVSKVGSYTGNGSTQTIDCGFGAGGARFVLLKRTDSTGGWYVYDTARGMTTLTDPYLLLNSGAAEVATLGSVTTVSTGFALNSAILAAINVSAGSYIFLAVA